MTGLVALALIVGFVLLLDSRSRLKQLEARLRRLEAALLEPSTSLPVPPVPVATPAVEAAPGPRSPEAAKDFSVSSPPIPAETEPEPLAAPVVPAVPRRERSGAAINFEELFGRRLPIWAGGITLAIAGVLIVKYAIDIGLFGRIFTPVVQIACGLLFGLGLIGGAELAWRQRDRVDDPRVGQALAGAGVSTLYAALLVAASAYALIPPLVAFVGMAGVTALALALSLRHGAPSALLGLAGGLAAPALTAGITANVPLLASYMAFTVAGLVGVARTRRWPWLALLALGGGAGWSLWLILAGTALSVVGTLSIGLLLLLLAVAAPLFAFAGPRSALLRTGAAVVGAAQLALLVALGGFDPLDWALFVMIVAAGSWLAWREESLRMVPTIGAVLSVLLLLIWADPAPGRLLVVAVILAAIHALPLLARLWSAPARVQSAVELTGIAIAAPLVALRHFNGNDAIVALCALGGALLPLTGGVLGWKVPDRQSDGRLAWLVGGAAALLAIAGWFALPHWQAPLSTAAIAIAALFLALPAGDRRIETVSAGFALLAILLLPVTVIDFVELSVLTNGRPQEFAPSQLLRWAGLAAMAACFAWRAERPALRDAGGFLAAALAYGAMAQVVPRGGLPLVSPLGILALAIASRALDWTRLRGAMPALLAIAAGWALLPMAAWLSEGMLSLAGVPMMLGDTDLAITEVTRRLFVPAVVIGVSLRLLRVRLTAGKAFASAGLAALLGGVAVHCFYRTGFAAVFGGDFVATGLAQRLLWVALLAGGAAAAGKRAGGLLASHLAPGAVAIAALHLLWYSLLLHDPLWTAQAVGPVPLANLLAPLFAGLPLCIWLLGRMAPVAARPAAAVLQPTIMVMVALFAWSTLRQLFHGSLLVAPGVGSGEDILRSILGIVLAIGYLLWGIHSHRRDWRIASLLLMLAAVGKVFLFDASGLGGLLRIASFVALGFSLIGIGWLYSRQLRGEPSPREPVADPT